ncbi:MAG: hypothetical protein HXY43_06920 [Fischerella sp.]|nr:hypothetical protein [Fischerella sp.]NWF59029.1 hypothetical protein [Fischerella sp.]
MLHSCLAVAPIPVNPQILGLAGQIPWLRSNDNHNAGCRTSARTIENRQ